jgi:hypothetical protein
MKGDILANYAGPGYPVSFLETVSWERFRVAATRFGQ